MTVTLFDFITAEDFRSSLEADNREMLACIAASAWKAVHVLAGSIVEAVLIDSLVAENLVSRTDALQMDLGAAIKLCLEKKIISSKTADLCSVIKGYRNLIHPGRIIRLNESVDQNSAEVAKALVTIVTAEVEKRRRENYGYTAEQIVGKIQRDSSSDAIVPHLLKATNLVEIERLLLRILPEQYVSASNDYESPPHIEPTLVLCFREAFEQASDEVRTKVTERFVTIIKEESDQVIAGYGTAFFRASDLQYVSPENADLVKKYLLASLQRNVDACLLSALSGIGRFLSDKNEVVKLVDPLVRKTCADRNPNLRQKAEECIVQVWREMPTGPNEWIPERLNDWVSFYRDKGQDEYAVKVEGIKERVSSEIPF